MHEIRGGQNVEEAEAWTAVAATLYDGEPIVALGPAKDVHERTVQLPGYNPWVWVAFTPSRYVEVPFATGNPSSYLLSDVERLEVKRGVLGGRTLVVKTSDAPDNLALEVLDVPQRVRGGDQAAGRHETGGAFAPGRVHPVRTRQRPGGRRRDRGGCRCADRRVPVCCAAAIAVSRPQLAPWLRTQPARTPTNAAPAACAGSRRTRTRPRPDPATHGPMVCSSIRYGSCAPTPCRSFGYPARRYRWESTDESQRGRSRWRRCRGPTSDSSTLPAAGAGRGPSHTHTPADSSRPMARLSRTVALPLQSGSMTSRIFVPGIDCPRLDLSTLLPLVANPG